MLANANLSLTLWETNVPSTSVIVKSVKNFLWKNERNVPVYFIVALANILGVDAPPAAPLSPLRIVIPSNSTAS